MLILALRAWLYLCFAMDIVIAVTFFHSIVTPGTSAVAAVLMGLFYLVWGSCCGGVVTNFDRYTRDQPVAVNIFVGVNFLVNVMVLMLAVVLSPLLLLLAAGRVDDGSGIGDGDDPSDDN